jgi:festuclavine dehydrogenase
MTIDGVMPSTTSPKAVLLLGGTGKVASRIAPLLSAAKCFVILASRSGAAPKTLPNCEGIKFDWVDPGTYNALFQQPISAIFLVGPASLDSFSRMKQFIDLARSKGVNRLVQLSASIADGGDGPELGKTSDYLRHLNIEGLEYAILRPTWFMGIPLSPLP